MAQIPLLIPGLLTMIPAALWMTYLYRRRRRPRPDQIHLHSLRSSLQRKRERKRQRMGQESGLEESRSLLASVSAGRLRRVRGEDALQDDADYDSDDEEEDDDSEEEEEEDDDDVDEDLNDENEHAVEIELESVMADLNQQLRMEQMKAELGQDGTDSNHNHHYNHDENSNDSSTASASTVIDLPPLPRLPSRSSSRLTREPSHTRRKKSHGSHSTTTPSNTELFSRQPLSSSSSSSTARATHRSIYGILYLNLLEARLPPPPFPASSSFVICSHGTQVYRTASSKRSNQPVWNQKVRLVVREREVGWPVSISLWLRRGKRRGGGVYCIGRTVIDIRAMMDVSTGANSDSMELAKLNAATVDRKRRRVKGEDGDDFPVKNFWRELTGQAAPQQQVASFYDTESAEPSNHASTSATNPLLPRGVSQSQSAVVTWLHLESLFLPLPSAAIGPQLWSDICSLYDVHDEETVDADHVQQLLECVGGMKDEEKADLAQRAKQSGGLTVEELSERLTRCETEREKEIKARRRQLKRTSSEHDSSSASTEPNTPNMLASDMLSSSSSATSLSSFLVEVPLTPSHALVPQSTDLTPVYLSRCPVCLLSLTPSSSLDPRDCLVHVRFCLETLQSIAPTNSSALSHSEFATGGFISEEYAVKNWWAKTHTHTHFPPVPHRHSCDCLRNNHPHTPH